MIQNMSESRDLVVVLKKKTIQKKKSPKKKTEKKVNGVAKKTKKHVRRVSAYTTFIKVKSQSSELNVMQIASLWKTIDEEKRKIYEEMAQKINLERGLEPSSKRKRRARPTAGSQKSKKKRAQTGTHSITGTGALESKTSNSSNSKDVAKKAPHIVKRNEGFDSRKSSKEAAIRDDRVLTPPRLSVGDDISRPSTPEQFHRGPYPSLDPDLVGLGWTETEHIFKGSWYTVFTGPYGLRCRNLEKARQMATTTSDLDLTCRSPRNRIPKRSFSESREGLTLMSTAAIHRLLARYTGRTPQQIKAWKHSKTNLIERLKRLIDVTVERNRNLLDAREKKKRLAAAAVTAQTGK